MPDGFAVITQTCDIDEAPDSPVVVAPIVRLDDEYTTKYGAGKSARYVLIDKDLHIDLDYVATVSRGSVDVHLDALTPLLEGQEARIRQAVARKFGRAAVPSHVVSALSPFRAFMLKKSRPGSPESEMIHRISEIRISMEPDWAESSPKTDVVVTLLVGPEEMPELQEGDGAGFVMPEWNANPTVALTEIGTAYLRSTPGSYEAQALWEAFADQLNRLIDRGVERLGGPSSSGILDHTVSVLTRIDFTLEDAENSDRLDLAHLSWVLEVDDD
jgi:hypothetical protein